MVIQKVVCAFVNLFDITLRICYLSRKDDLRFLVVRKLCYAFFGAARMAVKVTHIKEWSFSRKGKSCGGVCLGWILRIGGDHQSVAESSGAGNSVL